MITIRTARKEDYEEIMHLYGIFVDNDKRFANFDNDSYDKVLNDSNAVFEVAVDNDKIVGLIAYSFRNVVRYPKPIVEVDEFFVLEEYRRQKVGTKLMEQVFKTAKEKDCQCVYLASGMDEERKIAHLFYEKYDFDKYGFHFKKTL